MAISLPSSGMSFAPGREINLPDSDTKRLQLSQRSSINTLTGQSSGTIGDGSSSAGEHLMYGLPASLLAMADTFATSLSFGTIGDQDLENYFKTNVSNFGNYFNQNRELVGAIGDIGGALIPGMLATKAIRAGSWLARGSESLFGKNASRFFSTGESNSVLFEKNFQQARLLGLSRTSNLEMNTGWAAARGKALGRSVADTLIEATAADAAVALTMHNSDFLFPEEMTFWDNLAWFGGTNALVGGVAWRIAKRDFVRGSQSAFGLGKAISDTAKDKLVRTVPTNIVNARGLGISGYAQQLEQNESMLAKATANSDQQSRTVLAKENTVIKSNIATIQEAAFKDSPFPGVTKSTVLSSGTSEGSPQLRTLNAALTKEPNTFLGLKSFEIFNIGEDLADQFATEQARLHTGSKSVSHDLDVLKNKSARSEKDDIKMAELGVDLEKKFAQRDLMNRTTIQMVELDGQLTPLRSRQEIFQDGARAIKKERNNLTSLRLRDATGNRDALVDEHGILTLHPDADAAIFDFNIDSKLISNTALDGRIDAATYRGLSHYDKTAVLDVMQTAAERVNIETWKGAAVGDKTHWTQLDFLTKLIHRPDGGDAVMSKIEGVKNLEEIQFRSLTQKFDDARIMFNDSAQKMSRGREPVYSNQDNLARALNLPIDKHPLLNYFIAHGQIGKEAASLPLFAKNLDELRVGVGQMADIPGSANLSNMEIMGKMLDMPYDRKPVIALMENIQDRAAITVDDMSAMAGSLRAQQVATMRNRPDAIMTNAMLDYVRELQPMVDAIKRDLPLSVHGNETEGAIMQNLTSQPFRFREDPVYQHIYRFSQLTDTANEKFFENNILKAPSLRGMKSDGTTPLSRQEVFNNLVARGNEADLDLFHVARNAISQGWDLLEDPFIATKTSKGNELFNIALADTPRNKAIWGKVFKGQEMPDTERVLMPLRDGTQAVAVTRKASDGLMEMNLISQQLLVEENTRRASLGIKEIPKKNFHLPPPQLSNKSLRYLVNKAGEFVTVLGGNTEKQAQQLADQEIKASGGELIALDHLDVMRLADARGAAYHQMTDFSRAGNQTGQATGKSAGQVVQTGPESFHQLLETQLRQYADVGRSVRATLFQPELDFLRNQRAISGVPPTRRTIFDELNTAMTGVQGIDNRTPLGNGFLAVERVYDDLLRRAWDHVTPIANALGNPEAKAQVRYDSLEKSALEFNPFKSVDDYMERTFRPGMPPTLKKHAALLNEVTAAMTYRMFGVGPAIINFMSLLTTLPSVAKAAVRFAGEDDIQYARRAGIYSTTTPGGNSYISTAKLATSAIHFEQTPVGQSVLKEAAQKGLLAQSAAEQSEIWSRTGESFLPGILRWASNKASILTDWSENKARSISFSASYLLGKNGMQLDHKAAMVFAWQQANNVIGDFRPASRPLIFQGAAGMPLGLFTTYTWNFWQRLAGYVENGQKRALFTQLGMQTSLFGAESLPGWDLYTQHMMANYDGTNQPVDRLNQAFGSVGTDVFLNGSVSNLPRLFGMADGISMGPRAAAGTPFAQGFGYSGAAGVRMIGRLGQAFGSVVDSSLQERGIDPARIGEILATANINKAMSSAIEVGLGHSLDSSGGTIESDTRTAIGIGSRVLGFKPLAADELKQENARNRRTDRIHTDLKDRLAEQLKSNVRNGKLGSVHLEDALEDYVKASGSPEAFRRFFQSQVLRGATSKMDREIADSIGKSVDGGRLGRLLYLSRD